MTKNLALGVSIPVREAIFASRRNPSPGWPESVYHLIGKKLTFLTTSDHHAFLFHVCAQCSDKKASFSFFRNLLETLQILTNNFSRCSWTHANSKYLSKIWLFFFVGRDITVSSLNVLRQQACSLQMVLSVAVILPCFDVELYMIRYAMCTCFVLKNWQASMWANRTQTHADM